MLIRPVTVKDKETGKEVEVKEFDADNTGDEVLGLYTERNTETLDPDKFKIVQH